MTTPKQQEARRLRWQRRLLAMEAFDPTCPREARAAIRERLDAVQGRIDAANSYAEHIEREANAAHAEDDADYDGPSIPTGFREIV